MKKIEELLGLVLHIMLEGILIIVWLFLSWLIHSYMTKTFPIPELQTYKLIFIEAIIDLSILNKLWKINFLKTYEHSKHREWWR